MKNSQIKELVSLALTRWTDGRRNLGSLKVSLSDRAESFLVEIIENIEKDRSEIWSPERLTRHGIDAQQRRAISLIPDALDSLSLKLGRLRGEGDIVITTWEIWHDLSPILLRLCFIPKNI